MRNETGQVDLNGGASRVTRLVHTLISVPIFVAVWLVLSTAMTALWILMVGVEMWLPEIVIASFGAIIGSLTGAWAGVAAAKSWAKYANFRVVFVFLAIFLVPPTAYFLVDALDGGEFLPAAFGNCACAIIIFYAFWRGDPI